MRCFQQRDSQHESRYLATLLRRPNMLAIVAKIDIQILHSLSQFRSCVLLYFFSSQSCCVAGKGWGDSRCESRSPYVVTFGGLLMSWPLRVVGGVCASISASIVWPSASWPDITLCSTAEVRGEIDLKTMLHYRWLYSFGLLPYGFFAFSHTACTKFSWFTSSFSTPPHPLTLRATEIRISLNTLTKYLRDIECWVIYLFFF